MRVKRVPGARQCPVLEICDTRLEFKNRLSDGSWKEWASAEVSVVTAQQIRRPFIVGEFFVIAMPISEPQVPVTGLTGRTLRGVRASPASCRGGIRVETTRGRQRMYLYYGTEVVFFHYSRCLEKKNRPPTWD